MTKSPAISIIVPIYNDEAFLKTCLDSILKQTFANLEIIIVNDGSLDNSKMICDEYAVKDKRITVVHQQNLGISAARNAGLNAAKGDYIGFVDGDDYIEPDMYEKLYQACEHYHSDIAICKLGREINGEIINENDEENHTIELTTTAALKELFKGELYRFSLCNKLFSRSCFDGIVFPVDRIHEDLSTTYKLIANANKVVYQNFIGYIYVKQAESILTKPYYQERLDAFIGWDEINTFMYKEYPELTDVVNACFIYSCTDHAFYIVNQVTEKRKREKYLKKIQTCMRNYYTQMLRNPRLTLNYKLISTFLFSNIKLFIFVHYLTGLRKGDR